MKFHYRTKTGQFVPSIVHPQAKADTYFLSSSNDNLLSAHDNGEIQIWKYIACNNDWNLDDNTKCLEFVKSLGNASTDSTKNASLSIISWEREGRKYIINATSTGFVSFWIPRENSSSSLFHRGKAHGNSIYALTVWNDWLVTVSADNTIKVWNMEVVNEDEKKCVVKLVKMLAGHFGSIHAVIPFQKSLWTAGRDRTIRIWSQGSFKTTNVIQAHKSTITSLCEWRNHVASGSYDKTIKIWNKEGMNVKTFLGHQSWITCLCVWKDRLCSGSKDKTIRIWSWNGNCISMMLEEEGVKSLHVWKDCLWSTSGDTISKGFMERVANIMDWIDEEQTGRMLLCHASK